MIYTIPPESLLYHVTFVRIYKVTDDYVYVGEDGLADPGLVVLGRVPGREGVAVLPVGPVLAVLIGPICKGKSQEADSYPGDNAEKGVQRCYQDVP